MNVKKLHKEIEEIKARNKRVELDKAWETSATRKVLILGLTYVVVVLFFIFAGLHGQNYRFHVCKFWRAFYVVNYFVADRHGDF